MDDNKPKDLDLDGMTLYADRLAKMLVIAELAMTQLDENELDKLASAMNLGMMSARLSMLNAFLELKAVSERDIRLVNLFISEIEKDRMKL